MIDFLSEDIATSRPRAQIHQGNHSKAAQYDESGEYLILSKKPGILDS
jgi:hypothetical protein